MAFDLSGRLFATVDHGPCTPSELIELNPANGQVIRRSPIMAGSTEINIGDLAVEPSTGRLFGTRSVHGDANHAGELFVIDVASGAATFIGDTGVGFGEGLAFASDGALYLAGSDGGKPALYKIDPATAEPHQRDVVTGRAIPFVVLNDPSGRLQRVEGLAGHPDDGTLIATGSMTRFAGNQIVDDTYTIDLSTGSVTAQPLASPARGIFGDLAFQPSPRALDIVYQENFESGLGGFVTDNTGGTLPGLWHYSLGRRFDGLPSHTPISSVYYGAFETAFGEGNYVLPLDHEGTLTSPTIQLPTSSVLSFNYLLDTRPELDVDFVTVSVITADGKATEILSRANGTLPQTGRQNWRTATADLSAFACQSIRLQFTFDTGPVPQIDPEGWYLDDVMVASMGGSCDFGDAPDDATNPSGYGTLLANNGARHGAVAGFHLGAAIDSEMDGQPTPMADGDDNNPSAGPDDEDGVTIVSIDPARTGPVLFAGQQGQAVVELTNQVMPAALLDAWIDFNRDGDWTDDGEQVAASLPLTNGLNTITFAVPANAAIGETFARFRLSSIGGLTPVGLAADGEVEDYKVSIESFQPAIEIVKTGNWINTNNNGRPDVEDSIEYAFVVTNTGNVTLLNVAITDPMVTVNTLVGLVDADQDGMEDDLLPGGMATATGSYKLSQADVDARMKTNTASVNATAPNGTPVHGEDTAIVFLPSIAIIKTNISPGGWNDTNSNSRPDVGETIDYTFVVTNDGKLPLFNVSLADPTVTVSALSGLTDADQDGLPDDLVPGGMATATGRYVIKQADITAGQIVNVATANATDRDGNRLSDDDRVTTALPSPSIEIVKTGVWRNANNNGRPDVEDTISYTFKLTNTGNVPLLNVSLT
ncbi:MAG: GEVED domain-containing protein, partial [Planctomycetota bacterium]